MLDWRNAAESHRSHLSAFCCTLPDHGYFDDDEGFVCHDYPWELEVQDFIRAHKPPIHPPDFMLVGYDDEGLAAVLNMRVAKFDQFGFIQSVAVAQRASGNGLAVEAIGIAAHVMRKHGFTSFLISARIDPRNLAAKSAFTRAGYECTGAGFAFETWSSAFPAPAQAPTPIALTAET